MLLVTTIIIPVHAWNPLEGRLWSSEELTAQEEARLKAFKQELLQGTLAEEAGGITKIRQQIVEEVFSNPEIRKEFKEMYKETNGLTEHLELKRNFWTKVSIEILNKIIESTTSPILRLALYKVKARLEQQLSPYLTEKEESSSPFGEVLSKMKELGTKYKGKFN